LALSSGVGKFWEILFGGDNYKVADSLELFVSLRLVTDSTQESESASRLLGLKRSSADSFVQSGDFNNSSTGLRSLELGASLNG
jgi:hypothetical protein